MPEPRTITEAADHIRRGELTPLDLVDQCLARIDRYEPRVRAWVLVDRAGAREQAERLTAELKAGQNRGPLHGIPIGIKDIIDVFDLPTACGSKLWANSYARRDATVVQRLRQAGAVFLGKTVTTAFASFDPSITRNPWNTERTPGGSSSGSAASVACGMCFGALATQTGGSITRPAAFCGVASIKPTHGRVSVEGVMPLAPSLDHVGCMANSVRDLGIILHAISGSADHSRHETERHDEAYARLRHLAALPEFLPERAHPEMTAALVDLRERTTKAGWKWTDLPLPPSFADVLPYHHTLMAVEAASYHAERLKRHPDDYPPHITKLIRHGLGTSALDFVRITQHFNQYRDEIERSFVGSWRTFVTPASTGPAPPADSTGDPAFNAPWSYSGLPTVSLPIGWSSDGLPLCVQLAGEQWCEDDLLAVASLLEEATGFTPRPLPL
jgi:aspartyl-tRNA(Asn)/glutamyl-tRNA(Gln) amidotransferase subunit A